VPLTNKQRRFVSEYIIDCNATQAAIRAGYAKKNADVNGPRLLGTAGIAAAVAKEQAKILNRAGLQAEQIIRVLHRHINRDVRGLFKDGMALKPITDMTEDEAGLIAGFEVVRRNVDSGDGHQDDVIKIRLQDQPKYIELGMKHLGLLTEQVQLQGEIGFRWLEDGK